MASRHCVEREDRGARREERGERGEGREEIIEKEFFLFAGWTCNFIGVV